MRRFQRRGIAGGTLNTLFSSFADFLRRFERRGSWRLAALYTPLTPSQPQPSPLSPRSTQLISFAFFGLPSRPARPHPLTQPSATVLSPPSVALHRQRVTAQSHSHRRRLFHASPAAPLTQCVHQPATVCSPASPCVQRRRKIAAATVAVVSLLPTPELQLERYPWCLRASALSEGARAMVDRF